MYVIVLQLSIKVNLNIYRIKNTNHLKQKKKKKKSQSECENLFIFHIQELLLFPPIKHDKSHVKGNASGGVSESTFS